MKRVSVIIPVFNSEKFLPEAIATVRRSRLDVEIVIVDDGSTDNTESIAKASGSVQYVRQENHGPAAARNRALSIATGEFIAFLDADDLWANKHPASALAALENSGCDLALGQTQCLVPSTSFAAGFAPIGPPFHTFQLGSAICRRSLIDRAGGFDESMRRGEDVDWFLRVRECGGSIFRAPEVSLYYRLHARNRAKVYHNSRAGLIAALHQSLERRRNDALTADNKWQPVH